VVGPLPIGREVSLQEVREKKQLDYRKHNKQLYQNDFPQNSAHRHPAEPIAIKAEDFQCQRGFHRAPRYPLSSSKAIEQGLPGCRLLAAGEKQFA
jgi:hypothetical protein